MYTNSRAYPIYTRSGKATLRDFGLDMYLFFSFKRPQKDDLLSQWRVSLSK